MPTNPAHGAPIATTQGRGVAEAPAAGDPATPATIDALTRLFARTLRQLGQAGQPWNASRLAAEGWSLLRESHPGDAERLNGAMHYLARLEQQLEAQGHNDPQGA